MNPTEEQKALENRQFAEYWNSLPEDQQRTVEIWDKVQMVNLWGLSYFLIFFVTSCSILSLIHREVPDNFIAAMLYTIIGIHILLFIVAHVASHIAQKKIVNEFLEKNKLNIK